MRTILLADDNIGLTKALRRALNSTGLYDVHVANSADAAMKMACNLRPDLMMIDVFFGPAYGHDVIEFLETERVLDKTTVVYMSELLPQDEIPSLANHDVHSLFIRKPCRITEWLSIIALVGHDLNVDERLVRGMKQEHELTFL